MKKTIQEEYGIKVTDIVKVGRYDSFRLHQTQFIIVPVSHLEEEELFEIYQLSQFMIEKREPYVASIVLTKRNHLFFEDNQTRYVLMKCSAYTKGR
ncbi:MAG TPA: spore coat protein YutH, partial [Metabacillus sp.]|nr:spore coat protein YutH [Metabacillus sp.]